MEIDTMTHLPKRFGRFSKLAVAAALTLGTSAGVLTAGPLSATAQAAVSSQGSTLQDFAARGGVQDSPDNLTMPEPGVSRVHLDKGKMNGYKVRSGIPAADEATLTYKVRVPKVVHDTGLALIDLKMPGLAGSPTSKSPWYASSGGTLQPDSFSVRLHARKSSLYNVGHPWWDAYIYAPYAAGKTFKNWGIQVPITTGRNGAGARMGIPTDRWFDVKIRVELNTPGKNDGELDIWIDGQQGIELRDVRWRAAGQNTPINLFMAETFYNNPGAPRDGHIDFSQFRVTQGGDSAPAPTTPAPVRTTPAPAPSTTPAPVRTATPAPVVQQRPAASFASDRRYRVVRNGWGPAEKDMSNGSGGARDGGTLNIAGKKYAKGFGVHARSEIVVPVEGARTFTAQVGLESYVGRSGSVVFQVWDGNRKLADSGVVRGGQRARTLTANVAGRKEIRLVVTDNGDGSNKDHADWADAKFTS
ncbi:NPCBM/NEW2 domain-containing protein [Kineococcus sp. TRM81007]|uniref:NPCBM/NEW2 domain-containing protein n=1 Tax=Kineococcus sp. TRM81007 TaxID=2925831 RepID=UPI001F59E055|nr:NPCBM/NEW2 domain-containing protein [Kineococcus sp. TRM81007]MCI2238417.1 NPCBM/NEW2 domain-containing protein [Kineococcus sp. TRM81007]